MKQEIQPGGTDPSRIKSKKSRGVWLILAVPSLAGLLYLILVGIGAVLIVGDQVKPVDAVVVLSGDDGDRLALAIEMHEMGLAPHLVITDTNSDTNQRLIQDAQKAGFPQEAIFVTDLRVENTVDEARAVREFAQSQGWDELMIVTDPYHSLRTRIIFRRELKSTGIEIFVRPVVGHWFRSSTWFLTREGWRFAALEIIKIIVYLFSPH